MRLRLFVVGVALVTACGSSGYEPTAIIALENPWEGTYSLTRVNGARLPYTWIGEAGASRTIRGRTVYVHSDHTWSSVTTVAETVGGATTRTAITETGGWSRLDPAGYVTLTVANAGTRFTGTVDDVMMALSDGRDSYVFER